MSEIGIFPDLPCGRAGCQDRATHVAIQGHELAMLFPRDAAVMCAQHAIEAESWGAVSLSFESFGDAARREHARTLA